jgi:sugar lactone lactonase YvrE
MREMAEVVGRWSANRRKTSVTARPTNFVSNCPIGGDDGKTLYLVGSGKVHSLRLQVRGAALRAP